MIHVARKKKKKKALKPMLSHCLLFFFFFFYLHLVPFFFIPPVIYTMTDAKTPLLSGRKPPVSRPKNRRRRSSFEASTYNSTAAINYVREPTTQERSGPGLTLVQLLALTVCMAGVQFTCKLAKRCWVVNCRSLDFFFFTPTPGTVELS